MPVNLFVGGLVAAGFDPSGQFLLTVSHNGRGVFAVGSWERIARDPALAYPQAGRAFGIGPIAGQSLAITELDYDTGELHLIGPGGIRLHYEEGTLTISPPLA